MIDDRIVRIADKYQNKIYQEFNEHVDFEKVGDMKTNVYLLSMEQCVGEHEDLQHNSRKCVITTGDIYIKDKVVISERGFIHEYIHRMSRNLIDDVWFMGLQAEDDGIRIDINEAITEYFCWKIVEYDLNAPEVSYSFGIDCIEKLNQKIGYERLKAIYFHSQLNKFKAYFEDFNEICDDFYQMFDTNSDTLLKIYSKKYFLLTLDHLVL